MAMAAIANQGVTNPNQGVRVLDAMAAIVGGTASRMSGGKFANEIKGSEKSRNQGVSSGLARPHILAGVTPARATASHGPGIEPCSQRGNGLIDA